MKFTIPARLPGLNELIAANRSNPHAGAKLKKETDETIRRAIRAAKPMGLQGPVRLSMTFFEPNRRRDPDNVYSAAKYILDALVKEGVIENDNQRILPPPEPIRYAYQVDGRNPRVEVEIVEAEKL